VLERILEPGESQPGCWCSKGIKESSHQPGTRAKGD